MRMSLIVIALMLVAVAATTPEHKSFEFFMKTQNKQYPTPAEEHARFVIFTKNMKMAQTLETTNLQANFGASPLADLIAAEFSGRHNAGPYYA